VSQVGAGEAAMIVRYPVPSASVRQSDTTIRTASATLKPARREHAQQSLDVGPQGLAQHAHLLNLRSLLDIKSAAAFRPRRGARRVGATGDQVGDPVGERIGFAGTRARYDEERRSLIAPIAAVFDGAALLDVECSEVGGGHAGGTIPEMVARSRKRSLRATGSGLRPGAWCGSTKRA
jgi:hypothetical protein